MYVVRTLKVDLIVISFSLHLPGTSWKIILLSTSVQSFSWPPTFSEGLIFPPQPNLVMIREGSVVKNLAANAEDTGAMGLISELGKSPRGGNGNPLQCSYLENPLDRGAWWASVHSVTKSRTRLNMHTCHGSLGFMSKTV